VTALNFDTAANAVDRATVHYTVPKNGTKTSGRMGGLLNSASGRGPRGAPFVRKGIRERKRTPRGRAGPVG
jgi:hypothetical protein